MKKRFHYSKSNFIIASFLTLLIFSLPISFAAELNQSLTYDGNGNLITGDGKYREYNEFNQLIRVYEGNSSEGDILETYIPHPTEDRILVKYDDYQGFNNHDSATFYVSEDFVKNYDNIGGDAFINETYYVLDNEGRILGEVTYNGTQLGGNDYTKQNKLYYHSDHLGSTSVITNESGDLIEETFYSPYGAILEGGNASRYYYEGKEFSDVVGEYDFDFRKYNPNTGVFNQPDSAIHELYDPQSLNRYRFERNNPYNYVDEDGKHPAAAIIIAGAVGAVVNTGFYLATTPRDQITTKGALVSAGSGAVGGVVGASAVIFLGASAATLAIGGASSSISSQFVTNLANNKPFYTDFRGAAISGAASAGIAGKFLPAPQIGGSFYKFFVSKAGFSFARNSAIEGGISSALQQSYPSSGGASSSYNFDPSQQIGNVCYDQPLCPLTPPESGGNDNGGGNNGGGSGGIPHTPAPEPICQACDASVACCLR